MKNKLLKFLTCFAGISAIGSTITITSASCGCSNEQSIKALPDEVYDIDEATNVLKGFKEGIDLNQYKGVYDTMLIPKNVTSVANNAFYNNSASIVPSFITKLTFTKNSKCSSIGQSAFRICSSLTSINFLNCINLSTIDFAAFNECSSLSSVKFPSSLTTIITSAFENCSSLTSVDLSNCNNLNRIYDYIFAGCSSLSSITFPSLSQIDNRVFDSCSELTSITFPISLKKIGTYIFKNCSKLNDIKWESWNGGFESLNSVSFTGVSSTDERTITVINPIDGHDSTELLQYLKNNGGLPSNWIAV